MPDIFLPREEILPSEYPELEGFPLAILESHWSIDHFQFDRDLRAFKLELDDVQREIAVRCMLSISVVENKIKSFWAYCPKRLQKPEIANACFTFAGNEVVHQLAYQKLLDKLGLFERFSHIMEVEAMQGRVRYLNRYLEGVSSRSNKEFTKSLILFTLMTENVSLFSQFLIMSSFFKYENIFPNFSKIVTATGRDEILHGRFGSSLINIIRNENPEWFDDEMEEKIRRNIRKAYRAEKKVLDWIFENGELPWISKTEVEEYLKSRFNDSLDQIGYEKEFDLSKDLLKRSDYMDVLMMSSVDFDFFAGRGIDYAKNKAFSEDSLWD